MTAREATRPRPRVVSPAATPAVEGWQQTLAAHDRKPQRDRMWRETRRLIEAHLADAKAKETK